MLCTYHSLIWKCCSMLLGRDDHLDTSLLISLWKKQRKAKNISGKHKLQRSSQKLSCACPISPGTRQAFSSLIFLQYMPPPFVGKNDAPHKLRPVNGSLTVPEDAMWWKMCGCACWSRNKKLPCLEPGSNKWRDGVRTR